MIFIYFLKFDFDFDNFSKCFHFTLECKICVFYYDRTLYRVHWHADSLTMLLLMNLCGVACEFQLIFCVLMLYVRTKDVVMINACCYCFCLGSYCMRWGLLPPNKSLRVCAWKKLYIQVSFLSILFYFYYSVLS